MDALRTTTLAGPSFQRPAINGNAAYVAEAGPRDTFESGSATSEFTQMDQLRRAALSRPAAPPAVDASEIAKITRIQDPVVRNYRITQSYHDLSMQMAQTVGSKDANWCTFATWASRQAGQTIRGEDMPVAKGVVAGLGGPLVSSLVSQQDALSSQQVGQGNLKVFAEIAPAFGSFVNTFKGDTAPDQAKFDKWVAQFSDGSPSAGGQGRLKGAFTAYYKAKFETDPKKKAEDMLLGNTLVGIHEQTRLQPEIQGAMPAGARGLLTKNAMSLKLPSETLSLGEDIPPKNGVAYPANLTTLTDPSLKAYTNFWEDKPGLKGSGPDDWSDIRQRMHFIIELFRSRQSDPSLFSSPLNNQEMQRVTDAGFSKVGI